MALVTPRYSEINTDGSNWALPTGTQVGDSLLLWGFASTFTVTDARLTWHVPHSYDTEEGGFWMGTATSLDPIAGTAAGGTGVRNVAGRILTFSDRILSRRISVVDAGASYIHTVPVVPGAGSGAIVMALGWAGIGGPGLCVVSGVDAWQDENTNGEYDKVSHWWTTARTVTGPTVTVEWTNPASPLTYASVMVGIGGTFTAPPCRNIKRGDRLDLGGARNYPQSKMTNTSSRGVGAY